MTERIKELEELITALERKESEKGYIPKRMEKMLISYRKELKELKEAQPKKLPISDVLTVQLLGGANLDHCDQMRVSMFCMDCERVSEDIYNNQISKEYFLNTFSDRIIITSGYASFNSFCVINKEGLRDIAKRCWNVLTL